MEHGDDLPPVLKNLPLQDVQYLNDPNGKLYTAFKLGKGALGQLIAPQVLWRGLQVLLKGSLPGMIGKDVRQMPGAFVLSDGQIRSAHRAKDAGDHPDLEAMAKEFSNDVP